MARTTYSPVPAPPGGWPEVMDVPTAASYIGVGPEEIRVRCREGDLKHTRSGKGKRASYRIRKAWLDEHLDSSVKGGPVSAA
jgi:hypothetical protein